MEQEAKNISQKRQRGNETIKIAVCDDEEYYVQLITKRINGFRNYHQDLEFILDAFQDSEEFLNHFKTDEYDLIYLDIKLNGDNGMNMAKTLHKQNPECLIIFITNYMNYFNESFLVEAFQYMKKPIKEKFFMSELERAIQKIRTIKKTYVFSTYSGNIVFNAKEIYYIETSYKTYKIHSTKGEFEGSVNAFKSFQKVYPKYDFFRIQRSFYVNLFHVESFKYLTLILTNGSDLEISKMRYREFKKTLDQYLEM